MSTVDRLLEYGAQVQVVPPAALALTRCRHDPHLFDAAVPREVLALHTDDIELTATLEDKPAVRLLPGRAGVRLTGEVDLRHRGELREVLGRLDASSARTVHVQADDLHFIDVGCLTELMALSERRRLVFLEPPAVLLRLLGVLWPDAPVEVVA